MKRRLFLQASFSFLAVLPRVAAAQLSSFELDRFMALSSELSGFPVGELDRGLGKLYLDSLKELEPGSVELLLTGAGHPVSLQTLERSGLLEQPRMRELTHRLTELWYSGVRPTLTGSESTAYKESLAWRCVDFARPPTYCGPAWGNP